VRRLFAFALVASLATAVLGGLHYYIARRLVLDPALPEPWRSGLCAAVALLGGMLFLAPLGRRVLPPARARMLVWPAALWMGFAWLLLCGLAASDVLLWLTGSPALAAPGAPGAGPSGPRAALVAAVALVAGSFGLFQGLRPPGTRRVEIRLPRWPRALDGFRIAQISDIHVGPILGRDFASEVTRRVNALEPDLVAVTGDLVDGRVEHLAEQVEPFGGLRGRHGVFFVTGNHDHYSGARDWAARMRELGMRVLRNERVAIGGDDGFDLVGVDDHRGNPVAGDGREDLPRALDGRDRSRPAVLLAHDPSTFKRAAELGIDLQLSGHTHGGQIWPFGYLVRLAVPWVAGLHVKRDSRLYVSCGTGFWGPPMRLGAPAEITEIVIRSQGEAEAQ
jgi:predicted MPP superfamily phosphohydrolase